MVERRYGRFELYRRLFLEARPWWPHILALLFLNLLAIPLALLTPLPLKLVVDNVIGAHPLPFLSRVLGSDHARLDAETVLLFAVVLTVAVALLSGLQWLANYMLRTHIGEHLILGFRAKLFNHTQRLSILYHDSKGTNDSIYRIQYDTPAIHWILVEGLIPFMTAVITLVGMVVIIARIDWQLGVVGLGSAPALYFATRYYSPRMRRNWHNVRDLETGAFSVVQEVLGALRLVQAFRQEDREFNRFVTHASVSMKARVHAALSEGVLGLVVGLITATGTALVLYIGVKRVQAGFVTLGDLVLVIAYLVQMLGPLAALSQMTSHMENSFASAERAFALLDQIPDVVELARPMRLMRACGHISFQNVSFKYRSEQTVLRNITVDVAAGTRVGISGMTGAGKTTVVNLLMRFFDPTEGRILLDGIDLRNIKIDDLRNQFSVVLQDPVLFSTTIEENIAYGRSDASHDQIVQAAKRARAHDFICRLPKGYGSLVGERGMTLSGGERQRVALARVFLRDSPILVLDEPTSSVDVVTETEIIKTLNELGRGQTLFLITHRANPLIACDLLLKIVDGELAVRCNSPWRGGGNFVQTQDG
jgi:ATP-binding cassette subfamily B protein